MQDLLNHPTGLAPHCPEDGVPCPAMDRFRDQMAASCDLARKLTGTIPDLEGTLALQGCRLGQACVLYWTVRGGSLSIARDGEASGTVQLWLQ